MEFKCPICKKKIKKSEKDSNFPFCSERCRLIDLNAWFEGDYKISRPVSDEEDKKDDNSEK